MEGVTLRGWPEVFDVVFVTKILNYNIRGLRGCYRTYAKFYAHKKQKV